jgi:hypothetical protein
MIAMRITFNLMSRNSDSHPWFRRLAALLTVLSLGVVAGPVSAQSELRLSLGGSDLVGPAVEEAWQIYAAERGLDIRMDFHGSRLARDRLTAGVIDMAVLIDDPGLDPLADDWVTLPLAHAAALVVAPRGLALEQLSFADLNRIFNANSAVATTRWGDFGATGQWEYVPISMHILTAASGLAHEIFRHRVLEAQSLKSSVTRHDDLPRALAATENSEGGIAVVSWLPENHPKLKTLLISPVGDQVAFGPSAENMGAGDYPLSMPLRLVVSRDRAGELLPLLQFWYRDEITAALRADRLMPLPRADRNKQIFDLELIE